MKISILVNVIDPHFGTLLKTSLLCVSALSGTCGELWKPKFEKFNFGKKFWRAWNFSFQIEISEKMRIYQLSETGFKMMVPLKKVRFVRTVRLDYRTVRVRCYSLLGVLGPPIWMVSFLPSNEMQKIPLLVLQLPLPQNEKMF